MVFFGKPNYEVFFKCHCYISVFVNRYDCECTIDISSYEKNNLHDFINKGGILLIVQNRIKTDLSTQQATPIESNIFHWLNT